MTWREKAWFEYGRAYEDYRRERAEAMIWAESFAGGDWRLAYVGYRKSEGLYPRLIKAWNARRRARGLRPINYTPGRRNI